MLDAETLRFKGFVIKAGSHFRAGTKINVYGGKGFRQAEKIPAFKYPARSIFDSDGENKSTGDLGELDYPGTETIARTAWTVRHDRDIVSVPNPLNKAEESGRPATGGRTAHRVASETGDEGGNDFPVTTGAGEDSSLSGNKVFVIHRRKDKDAVVPEGPDHGTIRRIFDEAIRIVKTPAHREGKETNEDRSDPADAAGLGGELTNRALFLGR